MDEALARQVWRRAARRCEYCQTPQDYDDAPFGVDHVLARKHRGPTEAGNPALTCFDRNSHKGPNIAGRDLKARRLAPLFNLPRHRRARRHGPSGRHPPRTECPGPVSV
jgi:hypothetical protein